MSNLHRVGGETFVAWHLQSPSGLRKHQGTGIKRRIYSAWWFCLPVFLEAKMTKHSSSLHMALPCFLKLLKSV